MASFCSLLSAKGKKVDVLFFDKMWKTSSFFRLWQEIKVEDSDEVLHGDDALRKLEERARIWKEPRTV